MIEPSDDYDDFEDSSYTYGTVHRLLMAFHDDPIPNSGLEGNFRLPTFCRGLRSEWRGVLSFDGMERLDKVWSRE